MSKAGIQIRPIRTKQDHSAAVARVEQLMGAVPDSPEGDELDVLATLIDAYETKHHAIDAPDPITAIQFRMEQQHLTRKDLEPLLGSRARVSEVLTGKRPLTLGMVRRLRSGLGISADLLVNPAPALDKARPNSRMMRVQNIPLGSTKRRKGEEAFAAKTNLSSSART